MPSQEPDWFAAYASQRDRYHQEHQQTLNEIQSLQQQQLLDQADYRAQQEEFHRQNYASLHNRFDQTADEFSDIRYELHSFFQAPFFPQQPPPPPAFSADYDSYDQHGDDDDAAS